MIFVDTNVFVYAVGRPHPLREAARQELLRLRGEGTAMVTSAEVLQELMHIYLPVGRHDTLDAALRLATDLSSVLSVEAEDVLAARALVSTHPGLSARDLIHLATCKRHGISRILSFDRGLTAAFES